jgi:hypothetical protein
MGLHLDTFFYYPFCDNDFVVHVILCSLISQKSPVDEQLVVLLYCLFIGTSLFILMVLSCSNEWAVSSPRKPMPWIQWHIAIWL